MIRRRLTRIVQYSDKETTSDWDTWVNSGCTSCTGARRRPRAMMISPIDSSGENRLGLSWLVSDQDPEINEPMETPPTSEPMNLFTKYFAVFVGTTMTSSGCI